MYTAFFRATVLDKNEKCINLIEFSQPADRCVKTVKDRLLERTNETTYSCCMCGEVHDLKDASFTNQMSTVWDGKTATIKHKDGTESQIIEHNRMFEPCGEDEFVVTAVQKNRVPEYVPGVTL